MIKRRMKPPTRIHHGTMEPAEVESALHKVLPVVLAGIIGATSSEDGRDVFVRLLSNSFAGGFDNATARLETDPAGIAMKGNDALAWLLGRLRQEALVMRLAAHVQTSPEAAALLVGTAGSLTLAALGARAAEINDGAEGLLRELQDEKRDVVDAILGEFAEALRGTGGLMPVAGHLWSLRARAKAGGVSVWRKVATRGRLRAI